MSDRRAMTMLNKIMYGAVATLVTVLLGISGFMMKSLYADVKEKATKEEVRAVKEEMSRAYENMDKKTDLIINLIRDQSRDLSRMSRRNRSTVDNE